VLLVPFAWTQKGLRFLLPRLFPPGIKGRTKTASLLPRPRRRPLSQS
jgi:hypothetical protein